MVCGRPDRRRNNATAHQFMAIFGWESLKQDELYTRKADRQPAYEPLYDVDPRTGAAVEVFYADDVLAKSFGRYPGWWSCQRGSLPDGLPTGPFATSYAAYRNVAKGRISSREFGTRNVNADTVRTRRFLETPDRV